MSSNRRGYFGIGVYQPKHGVNIGTLWRSAYVFGASFIFTIGRRYQQQASDIYKAKRHLPLWEFATFDEFKEHLPNGARLVFVEQSETARPLTGYCHDGRAAGSSDTIAARFLPERSDGGQHRHVR